IPAGCPSLPSSLEHSPYIQVERYSRSSLVHHPIIFNHNYLSDSYHIHTHNIITD
uniref:Uncharacterized protein n=1 Tax=Spermophilus dauricus TaxID=99837 RepID=A0A8C9P5G9_SPEDA